MYHAFVPVSMGRKSFHALKQSVSHQSDIDLSHLPLLTTVFAGHASQAKPLGL
jgi:hypothetical protein